MYSFIGRLRRPLAIVVVGSQLALLGGCGADTATANGTAAVNETAVANNSAPAAPPGIRLVTVDDAAATLENPPDDLVVLDVRTIEEFEQARLADATMIDFYQSDFAEQLADLDRDQPHLLYCRSGNRSGQTRAIMEDLGFTNVADIDGGINAWTAQGEAVVSG